MGHSKSWGGSLDKWGRVEEVVDEGGVDCKGCGNWCSLYWSSSLNKWSSKSWGSMESWNSYGVGSSNNWGSNSNWSSSNNWGSWGNWVNKTIFIKVFRESLKSK